MLIPRLSTFSTGGPVTGYTCFILIEALERRLWVAWKSRKHSLLFTLVSCNSYLHSLGYTWNQIFVLLSAAFFNCKLIREKWRIFVAAWAPARPGRFVVESTFPAVFSCSLSVRSGRYDDVYVGVALFHSMLYERMIDYMAILNKVCLYYCLSFLARNYCIWWCFSGPSSSSLPRALLVFSNAALIYFSSKSIRYIGQNLFSL